MPSCASIFKGGQKMICLGVSFTPDIYANVHLIAWFFDWKMSLLSVCSAWKTILATLTSRGILNANKFDRNHISTGRKQYLELRGGVFWGQSGIMASCSSFQHLNFNDTINQPVLIIDPKRHFNEWISRYPAHLHMSAL